MTEALFRGDAYLKQAGGRVVAHSAEGGVILDQSLFYPLGGGQPGDSGRLDWHGGSLPIATTLMAAGDNIVLVAGAPDMLPPVGADVVQVLDWDRRHRLMRVHTALHLLSVVVPLPVSGGSIAADKGRLDFDMPEAVVDKEALNAALNDLVRRDLAISQDWISDADLDANPELVKTMSVKPPKGQGRVRLIRIGSGADQIDLQPCGGTHVASTAEIGALRIGKIQKKGRQNRRIYLHLDD